MHASGAAQTELNREVDAAAPRPWRIELLPTRAPCDLCGCRGQEGSRGHIRYQCPTCRRLSEKVEDAVDETDEGDLEPIDLKPDMPSARSLRLEARAWASQGKGPTIDQSRRRAGRKHRPYKAAAILCDLPTEVLTVDVGADVSRSAAEVHQAGVGDDEESSDGDMPPLMPGDATVDENGNFVFAAPPVPWRDTTTDDEEDEMVSAHERRTGRAVEVALQPLASSARCSSNPPRYAAALKAEYGPRCLRSRMCKVLSGGGRVSWVQVPANVRRVLWPSVCLERCQSLL